jgi:predicted deacylase
MSNEQEALYESIDEFLAAGQRLAFAEEKVNVELWNDFHHATGHQTLLEFYDSMVSREAQLRQEYRVDEAFATLLEATEDMHAAADALRAMLTQEAP